MRIFLSQNFLKKYKKITRRNIKLKEKISKKIFVFKMNPTHPSLKLHRLKGKMVDDWSIAVEGDLRIIFTYIDEGILLVDLGKHEEVY